MPRSPQPLTADAVCRRLDVSRETEARLEVLAELLARWQRRINLVSARSLSDLWRRHMLDSGQLSLLCPRLAEPWLDLGSGAGFPGLVLAILGLGRVELVESDARKCAFLREAARLTETDVVLHACRVESLEAIAARTITARAFAPLPRLLRATSSITGPETEIWLWKGQHIDVELTEAAKYWNMRAERHPSISDSRGTLLHLSEVAPCTNLRTKHPS